MEKQIQKIRKRMILIVVSLVALGIWQHQFIWEGIRYNLFVNAAIFLTIIGSVVLAFVQMGKLRNEITAFEALQETWRDIRQSEDMNVQDPFWRHYRCMTPGIVFRRPRILGHVYDLVTEELIRTRSFSISIETMQTLLNKIDVKLAEQRSVLSYLAGLLVFMGLIGTFMGLLKMVGSISGILVSLQSAGGDADGFGKLLTDLQAPLGGMATGFASSLFGLFGSLVVGLLGKLSYQAASTLKVEFESWLAAVAQIENGGKSGTEAPSARTLDGKALGALTETMHDFGKTMRGLDQSVGLLARSGDRQERQAQVLERIADQIARMIDLQAETLQELQRLNGLTAVTASLASRVDTVGREIGEEGRKTRASIEAVASRVADTQEAGLHSLAAGQAQLSAAITSSMARIAEGQSLSAREADADRLGGVIDKSLSPTLREIVGGLAALTDGTQQATQRSRLADQKFEQLLSQLASRLDGLSAPNDTSGLEEALATGLTEISRSLETVFSSFSRAIKDEDRAPPQPEAFDETEFLREVPKAGAEPVIATDGFRAALAKHATSDRGA